MRAWLECLFFGHDWERRSHPPDLPGCERAFWEDWHVCLRCGKDSRPLAAIEDDLHVGIERLIAIERGRKL